MFVLIELSVGYKPFPLFNSKHKKPWNFLFGRRFWTTYTPKQESPRNFRERSSPLVGVTEIVQISVRKEKRKRFMSIC